MLKQIRGLHHVTALASGASRNNEFFTKALGLRRVKKTVNFDNPKVYHLYYGDELGTPGTVMTYFPFPNKSRGEPGTGEVSCTAFSVPPASLGSWAERLALKGASGLAFSERFGEQRLSFHGPDGDALALVETADDNRTPWNCPDVSDDMAVRGFHSASMRLTDASTSAELLTFMGYETIDRAENVLRFAVPDGNGADLIDIETVPDASDAKQGAGSVHHIAFAVEDRARQLEVRQALLDTGYRVTPVIDRDYFWAIYFRTPGGVLFEVATNEPGFDRDEDSAHLGEALRLPTQHAHLREELEELLEPIED